MIVMVLVYRLNLEVVFHGIAMGFAGLECLLGIIGILMFIRIEKDHQHNWAW